MIRQVRVLDQLEAGVHRGDERGVRVPVDIFTDIVGKVHIVVACDRDKLALLFVITCILTGE